MADRSIVSSSVTGSRLLSIREVSEHLSVSERTVRRLVADGSLPAIAVGRSVRIDPGELHEWLYEPPAPGSRAAVLASAAAPAARVSQR